MAGPHETADGSRGSLTRARVVSAAVALADDIGIDALTIRRLATAIGVGPMTIYHHVPNKEAIIDGMVDQVFGEIELPPTDTDWKTAMRRRARSVRAVLARHPWATPLMESRTSPGPATLRHHDAVIGCLRAGGLSIEMTASAYALIDSFVYGFALQEANLPATAGAEMAELATAITGNLRDGEHPHLRELTAKHVSRPGYDFGAEFDFGLDLILDGLDAAHRGTADDSRK